MATVSLRSSAIRAGVIAEAREKHIAQTNKRIHPGWLSGRNAEAGVQVRHALLSGVPLRHDNGIALTLT